MANELMNKKELNFPKHSALIAMSNGQINAVQRKAFNGMVYLAKEQLKTEPISYKYKIPANLLMEIIGIGEENYTYLNKFLSKMLHTDVKYNLLGKDKKQEWGEFSLLAGYGYKEGIITYSFPHQIQDAIIDPEIYAWIDMCIIKGLKSKYALILYELLQDYINLGHPFTIKMDKFKELMGVKNGQYCKFSGFKQRVIDTAINEINNSGIKFTVEYELLKTGRKYTHIKFTINRKKKHKQAKQKQLYKNELEKQKMSLLLSLLPEQYRSRSAENILNNYIGKGTEYIRAQIRYTNTAEPKQYLAYLKKSLMHDYAGHTRSIIAEELKEAKKAAEEKKKQKEAEQEAAKEAEWERLTQRYDSLSEEEKESWINKVAEHSQLVKQYVIKGSLNNSIVKAMVISEMQKEKNDNQPR